ncbi:SDR family NAD(P)-dependent oxidoreductase [soil metagenome]
MSRRNTFEGARCLVTGASSGLGEALTRQLVGEGARVVMVARSRGRLERIAWDLVEHGARPEAVIPVAADVTVPIDRRIALETAAERLGEALDLVVNGAGVGAYGRFESHDESVLRMVFEVNFFAAAEICRSALPLLRKGDRPALVNIGSVDARRALPGRPEYSASKSALAALSDALRAEWATDGISVLLVNPGFTATAFEKNLIANTANDSTKPQRGMKADHVAQETLSALRRGDHELTLTGRGRLFLISNRLAPRVVDWGLGRWTRRLYADADALAKVESETPPTPRPPAGPRP